MATGFVQNYTISETIVVKLWYIRLIIKEVFDGLKHSTCLLELSTEY